MLVLADLNLDISFPFVLFDKKISFGVYATKADTPAVNNSTSIRVSSSHGQGLWSEAAIPVPAPAGTAIDLPLLQLPCGRWTSSPLQLVLCGYSVPPPYLYS